MAVLGSASLVDVTGTCKNRVRDWGGHPVDSLYVDGHRKHRAARRGEEKTQSCGMRHGGQSSDRNLILRWLREVN